MNYDSTDTNKMRLIIEEGREIAREKQMEDPTLKLILSWADAQTKPTQPSLGKLRVKRSKAIAAGADAVALWSLWEQLEEEWIKQKVKRCSHRQPTCSQNDSPKSPKTNKFQ